MKNREIETTLARYAAGELCDGICFERLLDEMTDVNQSLVEEFENIEKHYQNISLFLETLFRRSHFDHGRLIPRTKVCNMKKDVVLSQIDRYADQFKEMGIAIDDRLSGIPDEDIISVVDVGLMSQVYANLFSNALKYTQEVYSDSGERLKYISYGYEVIRDFFGPEKDGVKYNVFSTGPHIKLEERDKIFEEEYRGSNAFVKPGTGHGLAFVKNAIEIHGGFAGYEATPYGNNFFFILPR
jgi:signal transduction histidine kinase